MESNGHIQPVIPVRLLESWKGITDPKTRKTLQNRLNQRAYRCIRGVDSKLQRDSVIRVPILIHSYSHRRNQRILFSLAPSTIWIHAICRLILPNCQNTYPFKN
ncbi:hypothetical protein UA08_07581 [Talaromyces atroroseus]|uniref:Uncharacterized protein n=1 Tax=Talaromyces atroroseus TaxID=1441469 RepID=A0A225AE29_TALAT|nr:hypothetical protein UA08_07581 [Talaromyces atroroseus]OKL57273.1 hypothetical protein UA08_07581 [Talaromyces atroroseus]